MNNSLPIGVGVAFGIIIGAVMFALTQHPAWIAVGVPFGAAIGAAASRLGYGLGYGRARQ